jgi:hypothetical protein
MNTKQLTQEELMEQLMLQMIKNQAANTEALYELAQKIDNLTHGEIWGGTLVDAINELAASTENKK